MLPTFKQLFCHQRGCLPQDFGGTLLRESLYPHARPWLRLLSFLDVSSIRYGNRLLEEIGNSTSVDEVDDAIIDYERRLSRSGSLLLHKLRLRISCERLLAIYGTVMPHQPEQLEFFGPPENILHLPRAHKVALDF